MLNSTTTLNSFVAKHKETLVTLFVPLITALTYKYALSPSVGLSPKNIASVGVLLLALAAIAYLCGQKLLAHGFMMVNLGLLLFAMQPLDTVLRVLAVAACATIVYIILNGVTVTFTKTTTTETTTTTE
jgi:hypothetical protein